MLSNSTPKTAYIAFSGDTEIRFLRCLKKGYRHCFIVLEFDHYWCSIDPLATYCDVQIFDKQSFPDMPLWLRYQGHDIVRTSLQRKALRPRLFDHWSCVSLIKRVLGIQKWWLFTPWQLRRYLNSYQPCSSAT